MSESWVHRLPKQLACVLLAATIVFSQLNTSDSVVSVAGGDTLLFIIACLGIGFLVSLDRLLAFGKPPKESTDRIHCLFGVTCILFGGWLWYCTTQQVGRQNVRYAYNGCWQWIAQIVLMLSIARLSRVKEVAHTLINLMMACLAGTLGFAMFQYFVTMPHDRQQYANDPQAFLSQLGYAPGSSDAILYANRLGSLEPTGPFILTNSLAGFLAAWLVLLVGLFLVPRIPKAANDDRLGLGPMGIQRYVLGIGIVFVGLTAVTLLLTNSRTAWLASAMGCAATIVLVPTIRESALKWIRIHRALTACCALSCSLILAGLFYARPTLLADATKSLMYRFDYWRGAITLANESPWIGEGACNFQSNYNRVKLMTASESPADPHNFFLETLCAGGFPLLFLLLISLGIATFQSIYPSWVRISETDVLMTSGTHRTCGTHAPIAFDLSLILGAGFAMFGSLSLHVLLSGSDLMQSVAIYFLLAVSSLIILSRVQLSRKLEQCPVLLYIGSAVLLLHLVASGGWMLPGVMNSLCVMVGVGVATSCSECRGIDNRPVLGVAMNDATSYRWQVALGSLATVLALLAIMDFARTTLLPIRTLAEMQNAWQSDASMERGVDSWSTLMQADSFDPEPCRQVASECVKGLSNTKLSASSREKWSQLFDKSSEELLGRDPKNWLAALEFGKWNAMIADSIAKNSTGSGIDEREFADRVEKAFQGFQKCASLNPSSASAQLQSAIGAAWKADFASLQRSIAKAEEIDRITPHIDRKLNATVVFFPYSFERRFDFLGAEARKNLDEGMARGEPVLIWLRNHHQISTER
ncbi:MAG: O-antigen ligase family protein [Pirellula sp.]